MLDVHRHAVDECCAHRGFGGFPIERMDLLEIGRIVFAEFAFWDLKNS